ncbi:peptidase C15 [Xanthobacter sp. KR7-225]|uniref:pyroglutamyl-peptidase I family protein n=1 Tax=Xanthobacter sp. KR7-225 TaxID=3156613 RepID=UPI0032B55234
MTRPVLLVTAFGPFPGVPANPSAVLAKQLARLKRPALARFEVKVVVLPTRWDALDGLGALMARARPAAVLMLGVAARRRQVCVETRAVNAARAAPDAAKAHPPGRRLAPDKAAARRASARLAPLLAALRRHGVPARLSRDAGRYLCNAAYYRVLGLAGGAPAVFVHLPGRTGRPRGTDGARMGRALGDLLVALAAQAVAGSRP